MSLEPYQRGATWWAKGRVEYNGRPISDYIRESTGASEESGAWDWISEREEAEQRRYLIGEQHRPLTFADAVMLYSPNPSMAKYLIPIQLELGSKLVKEITPKMIRDLGKQLYPNNCTDSWRRWVIVPARAVLNNAHDAVGGDRCPAIRVEGYSKLERTTQDKARGKPSRVKRTPGSWEWLLRFREHAGRYHAALALFMFTTGARVGQATAMTPAHLKHLQQAKVIVPGAKGHDDRVLDIPMELVVELANLPPKVPRGWQRRPANKRVFGFASKDGPRKGWITACKAAGIPYLPPHSAGRHGFGQEQVVRQRTDREAAAAFGGWSDTELMGRTYNHAEDVSAKIHAGFRTGLVQAENETGLKLLKGQAK